MNTYNIKKERGEKRSEYERRSISKISRWILHSSLFSLLFLFCSCYNKENREEIVKAEDLGDFFRIPADTRDLNYNKYFTEGTEEVSKVEEYNSHNTYRLSLEETKELLLSLRFIRADVVGEQSEMVFEP